MLYEELEGRGDEVDAVAAYLAEHPLEDAIGNPPRTALTSSPKNSTTGPEPTDASRECGTRTSNRYTPVDSGDTIPSPCRRDDSPSEPTFWLRAWWAVPG